jgi:hypothetical protein
VRTYHRDLPWLEYALASVARWCRDFLEVVVVTPRSSAGRVRRALPSWARLVVCPDYRDDYLGQQISKLHADEYSNADLICHLDSDMLFTGPTIPADLLDNGQIRVVRRPIADLGRHRPWLVSTEAFLGWPVAYDFMQEPPFTFPRWLYGAVRAQAPTAHRVDLDSYVTSRPPRGFSEFNVLASYAYARHRMAFSWREADDTDRPTLCRWYWSRGGLNSALRCELNAITRGPAPGDAGRVLPRPHAAL